ncbi:hypothetical protein DUNSADRAFT_199 [Dunaliella salina]|nr:hypothetical protein DUNSADRAFT_199 [Dunaliella salina]|eukprot:KAF5839649.1 hypothetical protein DUNSADRAFT_199 [Dunaliella salina]
MASRDLKEGSAYRAASQDRFSGGGQRISQSCFSGGGQRISKDRGSSVNTSGSTNSPKTSKRGSARSSFAVEKDGGDNLKNTIGGRAKAQLQKQPHISESGAIIEFLPPEHLERQYHALGITAPDMPVPVTMLAMLWQLPLEEAVERVNEFQNIGVMRVATLEDGSLWCLTSSDHLQNIEAICGEAGLKKYHEQQLDAYTQQGKVPLNEVADDGYIVQNFAHHLVGAGRLNDMLVLLTDPIWLESKLHAYGLASVVQDFRRLLREFDSLTALVLLLEG